MIRLVLFLCLLLRASPGFAYDPLVSQDTGEATTAVLGFRTAADLKVELWAAEPMLANPVALSFDDRGRAFVCESFRQFRGIEDVRRHEDWLDEDLAARTIEDRHALLVKHLGSRSAEYTQHHERLRRIEDRDGDGRAETATVFADGFNDLLDGTGAGVTTRNGSVYYACIPHLWKLEDASGDGQADERRALHRGYGVKISLRGHDLHGLTWGPDGRLYFSIGDRGFHVAARTRAGKEYTLSSPDTGAVLRCEPDGTDLEVFATGLRNPQDLVFDELGNLFTCDNNSDAGDLSRWVYLMEGSDSGWQVGFQHLADRGPWEKEKLWHRAHRGQPAHIVPPVGHVATCPAGLAYHPGSGLPARYAGSFFVCDMRGSAAFSGVREVTLKPAGAGFVIDRTGEFLWGLQATDVEFGPDGAVYVCDWAEGWIGAAKGRIYRVRDPAPAVAVEAADLATLLKDDLAGGDPRAVMVAGFAHPDLRGRMHVQRRMVERLGREAIPLLIALTANVEAFRVRLHALWTLVQVQRKLRVTEGSLGEDPRVFTAVATLVRQDPDAELRAQAARLVAELSPAPEVDDRVATLTAALADPSRRVRAFAALGLHRTAMGAGSVTVEGGGSIGPDPLAAVVEALRQNDDEDPFLRHALVMALVTHSSPGELLERGADPSRAVRRGVLLALRRRKAPEVGRFLGDADATLVSEAVRAIHDEPIEGAEADLAARALAPELPGPVQQRILNANLRIGLEPNARIVTKVAADPAIPLELRIEAMEMLGTWGKPSSRDRVLGSWRPVRNEGGRSATPVGRILAESVAGLFEGPAEVRGQAARLSGMHAVIEAGPLVRALALDTTAPTLVRAGAVAALEKTGADALEGTLGSLLKDGEPTLRLAAHELLVRLDPSAFRAAAPAILESGSIPEKQGALAALARLGGPEAQNLVESWLDRLSAGSVPSALALDVLLAAESFPADSMKQKLEMYRKSQSADDFLTGHRECLEGGDVLRGKVLFDDRATLACLSCHRLGIAGGSVGPELDGIGRTRSREYLLEALVAPDRTLAEGYRPVTLTLTDGRILNGLVEEETPLQVTLKTDDGNQSSVPREKIREMALGHSPMTPALIEGLDRRQLRDLVEYLASLK